MGFLTSILTTVTKFLPSIGTGIVSGIKAGVQDAASRMGDSLLSSSTSDMSGAVRTYRNQYSFWSSQKPMGPYARFDKRLFEMTKVGGKYGVKPMGYFDDPFRGYILNPHRGYNEKLIARPMGFLPKDLLRNNKLPSIPTMMSRGQNSLFFPERRITNC